MNKIIIAVLAAVLVVGGGFALTQSGDDSEASSNNSSQSSQTGNQDSSGSGATFATNYLDYSQNTVDQNQGKTKLVFFHADWCVNCRAVERNLMGDEFPTDVVILEANYDDDTDLRQRYGVTQQTTFVHIDDNGNELNQWVARASDHIEDILAQVN